MFEHPHAVRVGIALGVPMLVGGLIVYIFGNLDVPANTDPGSMIGLLICLLGPLAVLVIIYFMSSAIPESWHTGRPMKRYDWSGEDNLWYEIDGRDRPFGEGSSAYGLVCKGRKGDRIYVCHDSMTYFKENFDFSDS